jgi:heavy metal translocating P-type ATPase
MPLTNRPTSFSNLSGQEQERRLVPAPDSACCEGNNHDGEQSHEWSIERIEIVRIAIVALSAGAAWFHFLEPIRNVSVIGIAGLIFGGWPIFRKAIENIAARRMTMELSMTIAIVSAAGISEFFTALVITLFVLVAEVLEEMTVSRGRRAIRNLLEILPRSVSVRRAGTVQDMNADELKVGDAVLVNPGGNIPVDGKVISGYSYVDQSRITGESMPLEKTAGAIVYAGSINQSGVLEIRTDRIGRDTSYGKIIEAVEQAEQSRAPVQRLADQLAGYLVYFALGAAILTYVITRNIYSTISVVIVAGACGIAAGTPLAILGGIGRAARLGSIIKGGLYLELLGRVDTVVLDKTGTLTFGQPKVQAVVPFSGINLLQVIDAAAGAESRSEHPLGKAIVTHARELGRVIKEPDKFEYTPGRGIAASLEGKTVFVGGRKLIQDHGINIPADFVSGRDEVSEVFVAQGNQFYGVIAISDTVRPEAKRAIQEITRMGIRTILLTGDSRPVSQSVARQLAIKEMECDLLPEDKLDRIKSLVTNGCTVAMLGDGINDAPALTEANVGVAMGSGTDIARESADVVLIGNDFMKFAETLTIARHTRAIIWQNFAGTILVDTVGIGLAAVGLLNPLFAAFIHVSSELAFILNSARLLRAPPDKSTKF